MAMAGLVLAAGACSAGVTPPAATQETEAPRPEGDLLVEASRSAELVVVGSRGYGGFRGLLMGSVSQAVLNEGESPVMIIPTRRGTGLRGGL